MKTSFIFDSDQIGKTKLKQPTLDSLGIQMIALFSYWTKYWMIQPLPWRNLHHSLKNTQNTHPYFIKVTKSREHPFQSIWERSSRCIEWERFA